MWTPYRTRNNHHHEHLDSCQSNEYRQMYSHRDYLRAVLESGEMMGLMWRMIDHLGRI